MVRDRGFFLSAMRFGRQRTAFVAVCGVWAACFAAAWVVPAGASLLPGCMLYRCTGLLCFGCGCTRAMQALVQGDVAASLAYNPLMLPSFVWLAAVSLLRGRTQRVTLEAGLAVLLLFMLVRNIPVPCFDCLRPPC